MNYSQNIQLLMNKIYLWVNKKVIPFFQYGVLMKKIIIAGITALVLISVACKKAIENKNDNKNTKNKTKLKWRKIYKKQRDHRIGRVTVPRERH